MGMRITSQVVILVPVRASVGEQAEAGEAPD